MTKAANRIIVSVVVFLFVSAFTLFIPAQAHAEPDLQLMAVGNTVPTAERVSFGQTYTGGWNKDTDHLNCYSMFTVPSAGTVSMKITKPFDSEGEYGGMYFDMADEDGNDVWWNQTSKNRVKSANMYYNYSVNLEPGTYVINMTPAFTVISGTITFEYTFTFKANPNVVTEPNQNESHPFVLKEGVLYDGLFGSEYYMDHSGNIDNFEFTAPSDDSYYLAIGNISALDQGTTWLCRYTLPGNANTSIGIEDFNYTEPDGLKSMKLTMKKGQKLQVVFYNYKGDAIPYQIRVRAASPTKDIDDTAAVLKSDGYVYRCNAKGKDMSKQWANVDELKEVETLYIDSSVSHISDDPLYLIDGTVSDYSFSIAMPGITTVKYLTNKKGKASCKTIDKWAFSHMTNLAKVVNLNKTKLKTIKEWAFADCAKLKSISVPKTLKTIGDYAFQNCKKLKKITGYKKKKVKNSLTAFKGCPLK